METPSVACSLCPRLVVFRGDAVPAVGSGTRDAAIMVVRALPGNDDEAALLHHAMAANGVAEADVRVTHALRCAPPGELAEPSEVMRCNMFLAAELRAAGSVRAVLALGILAHEAVLLACGVPSARARFRHGMLHDLPDGLILADAHPPRHYLTSADPAATAAFDAILGAVSERLRLRVASRAP